MPPRANSKKLQAAETTTSPAADAAPTVTTDTSTTAAAARRKAKTGKAGTAAKAAPAASQAQDTVAENGQEVGDDKTGFTAARDAALVDAIYELQDEGIWTAGSMKDNGWSQAAIRVGGGFTKDQVYSRYYKVHSYIFVLTVWLIGVQLRRAFVENKTLANFSGFGWDEGLQQFTAEPAVWVDLLQVRSTAVLDIAHRKLTYL